MYEITFIAKEEKDDVVKKTIESLNGKITQEEFLGRKKFYYPIKKEGAGFYTTYVFEIDPEKINDLNKTLLLKGQILRFLIIIKKVVLKKPKEKKKETVEPEEKLENIEKEETEKKVTEEVTKKVEINKEKIVKPKEKIKEEVKEEKITKEEKPVEPKKKLPKKEDVSDEEERLKALEKKLEEILKA